MEYPEQLSKIRNELERLVALRQRRPLSGPERDRWNRLVNLERQLLDAEAPERGAAASNAG